MTNRPERGRVLGLPDRPTGMLGRDSLLRALVQALEAGSVVALRGPAGAGKTWVAQEYAHRMATLYDVVWWVDAAEPEQIPDRLAALARALGVADPGDPPDTATARLLEHLRGRGRWLLIFDEAGAPGQLDGFLPGTGSSSGGHVLVTSRHPGWPGAPASLEVLPLDKGDVARLLRSAVPDLSTEDADRAAAAVGGLPADVSQARAALTHGRQFVPSYVADVDRLVRDGRPGGEAVWHVAFDRLDQRRSFDPGAFQLLTLLAWLSPEPIPRDGLAAYADDLPHPLRKTAAAPDALARVVAEVRERGLADEGADGLRMARRPAEVLRARTAMQRPDDRPWPELVARMLLTAARQRRASRADDAFVLLSRVFGYCSELLRDDHPVALAAIGDLASMARERGDQAGAKTLDAWLDERRRVREEDRARRAAQWQPWAR